MDTNIVKICGASEITPDFESIASNPNFIFESDENFTTVVLYNSEGSVINVNSWLECANYVNGGWFSTISDLINYEQRLFFSLLFIAGTFFLFERAKKFKGWGYSK